MIRLRASERYHREDWVVIVECPGDFAGGLYQNNSFINNSFVEVLKELKFFNVEGYWNTLGHF